jgi:4-methyl-5(b-hydroxyethyl)-thiazole monophosphate biosynthesis
MRRNIFMAKKVLVPIADGIEEIETMSIVDVLRRAEATVIIASITDDLQITAAHEIKIVADKLLTDCINETYDLIVLPGGMPGAEHLRDCPELITMLKQQQQENRLYAAICASPAVVLQHHGLLPGIRATCHPSMWDQLAIKDESRVVVDKNCITSQGPGTALEFAIKLVELVYNKEKAEQIAKAMICKIL